ncbi:MAG: LamG domain-containing protein [Patescibacteria group bacterium]
MNFFAFWHKPGQVVGKAKSFLSFSFIELLLALGIVSIIFSLAVFYSNPIFLFKGVRDGQRVKDLNQLFLEINHLSEKFPSESLGNSSVVYLSLPDSAADCSSYNLPALPSGWSYYCSDFQNYRKSNGLGWLPINFSLDSIGPLPEDPLNSKDYYYAYVVDNNRQFVLTSLLESEKYLKGFAFKDGGIDDSRFEIGANLFLWSLPLGLSGYWDFDQLSGSLVLDRSGYANNGDVFGAVLVPGKTGSGLSFDGNGDYVQFSNLPVDTASGGFNSVELWMYWNGQEDEIVFGWDAPYGLSLDHGCLGFNVGQGNLLGVSHQGLAQNWAHLVAVFYNGVPAYDNVKLYLNGKSQDLQNCHGSTTPAKNATQTGFVGTWGAGQQSQFNGIIDGFKIYNRILTEAEVQALYQATK